MEVLKGKKKLKNKRGEMEKRRKWNTSYFKLNLTQSKSILQTKIWERTRVFMILITKN